jgi:aspartate/methionine/tyrosine aminotransferase
MKLSSESATIRLADKAKTLKQRGVDLIDLTAGQPHFDTPSKVKESAKKALDSGFTSYTQSSGIPELITALRNKLKNENGIDVEDSQILVTVGAKEAVFDSVFCTINPLDEVLIPDPYWNTYGECVKLAGGVPISVPITYDEEEGFRLDIERMRGLVSTRTKLLMLNSPHNPTGMVLQRGELESIAEICKENDLLVVSDEIYEKIVFDDSRHYSIGSFDGMEERTVTINGFSKAFAMTGWRLGYAAGPKEVIDKMKVLHQHTVTHPASFAQKAAVVAIKESEEEIEQMRQEYQDLRDFFFAMLQKRRDLFSATKPEGTFYSFPKIKNSAMSSQQMADALLEKAHILCVPGAAFGNNGGSFLRFVFANNMATLEKVGKRIEELALPVVAQ